MTIMPAMRTSDGTTARPSIQRHAPSLRERVVDEIRDENADGDRELIERDQRAAVGRRRYLRDVERRDDRAETDADADDESSHEQHRLVGRECRDQRAG